MRLESFVHPNLMLILFSPVHISIWSNTPTITNRILEIV